MATAFSSAAAARALTHSKFACTELAGTCIDVLRLKKSDSATRANRAAIQSLVPVMVSPGWPARPLDLAAWASK